MAADEALLRWGKDSVLRAYSWKEPTVTFGYFDHPEEAQRIFPDPGIYYVRRWTGGGIVDHRHDFPFTLAMRLNDLGERFPSAYLYQVIHGALAKVLIDFCGIDCRLLGADAPNGGRACFASPVTSDIVLPDQRKVAGGGQRRTQYGILHQGSIQNCTMKPDWDLQLAQLLAPTVDIWNTPEPFDGFQDQVNELVAQKYSLPDLGRGHAHA
jgi:lipoate-protein ligase A